MNERLLTRLTAAGKQDTIDPMARLSDREFEVFQLIGQGYDTRLIAESLCLSIKTIETYKSHLKTKLDLKNSTELMQRAVEWSVKHRR